MYRPRISSRTCLFLFTALTFLAGPGSPVAAQSLDGLPLPPGQIITGPVYRGVAFGGDAGTSVPEISNGTEADSYVFPKYSLPPFVPAASAIVVQTSVPTQWVRFFNPNAGSGQVGGFIAGSNVVRGLTPEQVQAVLALSYTPTMETLVQVPAGTCLLIGSGNSLWGQPGGPPQEFLIGASGGGAGCGPVPQYIPSGSFINAQTIGVYALAYVPRAGSGNAGAIAYALDHATPPALFTSMDGIYNALDVLNIGDPGPLRAALVQLDGEVYADVPSVAIATGQMFLDVLHDQTYLARGFPSPAGSHAWRIWESAFGGGGTFSGGGDAHRIDFAGGGGAIGADRNFTPNLLGGVAVAYSHTGFGTSGISGSGGLDSVAIASYAGYTAGQAYFDGALGYSYDSARVSRTIAFPGVWGVAYGNPTDNVFLSRVESGYRAPVNNRTTLTPFASFQGIVAGQNSFGESGAEAAGLNVRGVTDASAQSILGGEVSYDLPVGFAVPLSLAARAGWAHDFADVNRGITAGLQGTPDASFTVNGTGWPRDAAVVEARAALTSQQTDLFIRYDGLLGEGASINSATAGLRLAF